MFSPATTLCKLGIAWQSLYGLVHIKMFRGEFLTRLGKRLTGILHQLWVTDPFGRVALLSWYFIACEKAIF